MKTLTSTLKKTITSIDARLLCSGFMSINTSYYKE